MDQEGLKLSNATTRIVWLLETVPFTSYTDVHNRMPSSGKRWDEGGGLLCRHVDITRYGEYV
jgi:hypothetical protein